ncbi:hypothetical protein [Legionella hackeliae]|uniref:hypothetical protein n=1 Tax=Legionella hackeliae TaxID=449 RepID=UPI00072EFD1A|nr:hypothetical protein [Legionella hackeliae]KTD12639.1 hypothetical protein Lhac_1510 [Legionella hackeliae]
MKLSVNEKKLQSFYHLKIVEFSNLVDEMIQAFQERRAFHFPYSSSDNLVVFLRQISNVELKNSLLVELDEIVLSRLGQFNPKIFEKYNTIRGIARKNTPDAITDENSYHP